MKSGGQVDDGSEKKAFAQNSGTVRYLLSGFRIRPVETARVCRSPS